MAPAVSEEDLNDEFCTFGLNIDDPDVVCKLQELCSTYRLDASGILDEWMAFAQTKKGVKLNPQGLDQFDREKLSKRAPKTPLAKKGKENKAYDISAMGEILDQEAAESLYNAYATPSSTPSSKQEKAPQQKRQHTTPDNPPLKRFTGITRSPHIPFSPASFSPAVATPSKKYSSRANSGEVIQSHGDMNLMRWNRGPQNCSITAYDPSTELKEQYMFMFQKLSEKAYVLNDLIEEMAAQLQKHHNIEEYAHVSFPVQEEVTIVGRVCCDSQGKLNAKSVIVEGSRESSAGRTIPLDLSQMKEYSLFPGQISAFTGTNNTAQKFVATKQFEGITLPSPEISSKHEPGTTLNVVIACGPYTTSDCMVYEPLADLLKNIQKDKPDVCILMGPFVDIKNEEIDKGTLKVPFIDLFNRQMSEVERIAKLCNCQMIVVPSSRDAHHDPVYPQPPFNRSSDNTMHYVSDPCTLSINGIVFGITSTDALLHLGTEEISFPPGSSDRLSRLTQHLITQQSYYPLYPPSDDVNIDFERFEMHSRLPVTPHILIVPSQLKYFIKDVKDCCCVNPGQLAKGQIGGTYAKMSIDCSKITSHKSSFKQNIAAQILRI